MPDTITLQLALTLIVVGFCLGLGWAAGAWLWSALIGAAARRRGPNA